METVFFKVMLGTVLLASTSAIVGSFSYLKKQSLVGDAVAHAILPGVVLAFFLGGEKNPWYLVSGALITGLMAHYGIEYIQRYSKLKPDTAIALVLSVFFGIGIMLMSLLQDAGVAGGSGLDRFLLGKAAAITQQDLWAFGALALFLILGVLLFYKGFQLMAFNEDFARAAGLPVEGVRTALTVLTVLAITLGIQTVGVVLMAALLITPAAAARAWTSNLPRLIVLSAIMAGASAALGTYVSSALPKMPTGPWIVVFMTGIAAVSLLVAPEKGWLARYKRARRNSRKTNTENVIKIFYQLEEREGRKGAFSMEDLLQKRAIATPVLKRVLRQLVKSHWLTEGTAGFALTERGRKEGRRVVRLHRLWELYLTERMRMKSDHIHPGAETMEHLITPEIEQQLIAELGEPAIDPHNSPIPYDK